MSDDYARGVLGTAVTILAGLGSIQERVDSAWLAIHTLTGKLEHPQDQEIFNEIGHAASGGKAMQMTDLDAHMVALKIVELQMTVARNEVDAMREEIKARG